jgi:hypothetical protein
MESNLRDGCERKWSYTWDYENRLKQASKAGSIEIFGNRGTLTVKIRNHIGVFVDEFYRAAGCAGCAECGGQACRSCT